MTAIAKRYGGKGVLRAVASVNETLGPAIEGLDATAQREIDERMIELDGTTNKSNLGANAILGCSLAVARAAASSLSLPLFRYLGWTDGIALAGADDERDQRRKTRLGCAAVSRVHDRAVGAPSFAEAVRYGSEVFHALGTLLHDRGLPTQVGDEGGYAPPLESIDDAMQLLVAAIERAGYKPGTDIAIALDPASSEFYETVSTSRATSSTASVRMR